MTRVSSIGVRNRAQPDGGRLLARVTLEVGPIVIAGVELCTTKDGTAFFRWPRCHGDARVAIMRSPERNALMAEAMRQYVALSPRESADTPLAPASDPEIPE